MRARQLNWGIWWRQSLIKPNSQPMKHVLWSASTVKKKIEFFKNNLERNLETISKQCSGADILKMYLLFLLIALVLSSKWRHNIWNRRYSEGIVRCKWLEKAQRLQSGSPYTSNLSSLQTRKSCHLWRACGRNRHCVAFYNPQRNFEETDAQKD